VSYLHVSSNVNTKKEILGINAKVMIHLCLINIMINIDLTF